MESIVPGAIVEGALPPCEQHVGDDPHTPHVRTCARLLAVHHLGRHELDGPLQFADVDLSRLSKFPSKPKVNYFQSVVRVLEK